MLAGSHRAHESQPGGLAPPVGVGLAVEELFAVAGALGVGDRPEEGREAWRGDTCCAPVTNRGERADCVDRCCDTETESAR